LLTTHCGRSFSSPSRRRSTRRPISSIMSFWIFTTSRSTLPCGSRRPEPDARSRSTGAFSLTCWSWRRFRRIRWTTCPRVEKAQVRSTAAHEACVLSLVDDVVVGQCRAALPRRRSTASSGCLRMTGSGRLRGGCGSTTVRVTTLIGQNISSRLHCGEGNWGQIYLSCFSGPESNGSSLRGMLLLPSGSEGSTITNFPQYSQWAKVSVATVGSLLMEHFYCYSTLLVRRKHNTVAFQVSFGHVCDFALFTVVIAIVVVVICC
jgi:hypothetical protein